MVVDSPPTTYPSAYHFRLQALVERRFEACFPLSIFVLTFFSNEISTLQKDSPSNKFNDEHQVILLEA
jgi:hypothetical protein